MRVSLLHPIHHGVTDGEFVAVAARVGVGAHDQSQRMFAGRQAVNAPQVVVVGLRHDVGFGNQIIFRVVQVNIRAATGLRKVTDQGQAGAVEFEGDFTALALGHPRLKFVRPEVAIFIHPITLPIP